MAAKHYIRRRSALFRDGSWGNEDHIARLKSGVAAWNAWRDENPNIRPDLIGADLTKADLTEADLFAAKLDAACLSEAQLGRADLSGALLSGS